MVSQVTDGSTLGMDDSRTSQLGDCEVLNTTFKAII